MTKASLSLRKFNLTGDIDEDMFCTVEWYLTEMEKTKEPIHITICSEGGESVSGMALAERILKSSCEIQCDAYGSVFSAAVGPFLAAHKRRMSRNCWFMHHEDSQEIEGRISDIKSTIVFLNEQEDNWNSFVASRTKRPASFWCNIGLSKDRYLNAGQCLKMGVIHEII